MKQPFFQLFRKTLFCFLSFFFSLEGGDLFDGGDHLFGGNQLGALEVTVCALVTGAPEEVEVVEVQTHIVPAAVAGVVVDNAVRCFKFVGGMGETGDHHHRNLTAPCQPAQAGTQTDEEIGIFDQIDPFLHH